MGVGVLGSGADSGDGGGISWSAGSGEKSTRSSRVNTGGGGGLSNVLKFSRRRAETAAAWPGVAKREARWDEIGDARSRKKRDCRSEPLELGVLLDVEFIFREKMGDPSQG